jgi:ferredoxin
MSVKVEHDRPNCIACAACSIVAPEFWQMSAVDGKSDLVGSQHTVENGEIVKEELAVAQESYDKNKEAADMCPVNVIHIFRNGEKII